MSANHEKPQVSIQALTSMLHNFLFEIHFASKFKMSRKSPDGKEQDIVCSSLMFKLNKEALRN